VSLPVFYHSNLFALGTLTGTASGTFNPLRRIADGDIGLPYNFTTGDPPIGSAELTLSGAALPVALVMVRMEQVSGYRLILESEDVGGGNNVTVIDDTLSDVFSAVYPISGSSARRVWRLTLSGVSGLAVARVYESMLASTYTFPRPVEVGVSRTRIRQCNRIDIPGGQPFTQQMGPMLRQNDYSFFAISGSEIDALEEFILAIDDGGSVYHEDDLGAAFWAEVFAKDLQLDDQAGVFGVQMTAREVRVNGQENEPR